MVLLYLSKYGGLKSPSGYNVQISRETNLTFLIYNFLHLTLEMSIYGVCVPIDVLYNMSHHMGKPTMWILTRSDQNKIVKPLEMVRGLKFWM